MSSSLIVSCGSIVVADNTSRFIPIAGGIADTSYGTPMTEAQAELPIVLAGVASKMFSRVSANTASVNSTIHLRKNQASPANGLTVTYTSDLTGVLEDTTNSVSYDAGDKTCWLVAVPTEAGTNNITIKVLGFQFDPTDTSKCWSICNIANNNGPEGGNIYFDENPQWHWCPNGGGGSGTVGPGAPDPFQTESGSSMLCRFAFTVSRFYGYIFDNACVGSTLVTVRKNFADGNNQLTFTTATGIIDDATHSDDFAIGDHFNFGFRITGNDGVGGNDWQMSILGANIVHGGTVFPFISSGFGNSTIAAGATHYRGVSGSVLSVSTTESNTQFYPRMAFTARELTCHVPVNNNTDAATTVTLRKGGADTALTLSIPASLTGDFTDTTNSVSIDAGPGNEINYKVSNLGATSYCSVMNITMLGHTGAWDPGGPGGPAPGRRLGLVRGAERSRGRSGVGVC